MNSAISHKRMVRMNAISSHLEVLKSQLAEYVKELQAMEAEADHEFGSAEALEDDRRRSLGDQQRAQAIIHDIRTIGQ